MPDTTHRRDAECAFKCQTMEMSSRLRSTLGQSLHYQGYGSTRDLGESSTCISRSTSWCILAKTPEGVFKPKKDLLPAKKSFHNNVQVCHSRCGGTISFLSRGHEHVKGELFLSHVGIGARCNSKT